MISIMPLVNIESDEMPISVAAELVGMPALLVRALVRDGVVAGNAPYRVADHPIGTVSLSELQRVKIYLDDARRSAPDSVLGVVEGALKYGFSDSTVYRWIKSGWLCASDNGIHESELAYARALADLKPRRRTFPNVVKPRL